MSRPSRRPPGPSDPYDPAGELLPWLAEQRSRYGDLFQASIYGRTVYVLSAPAHAHHVLVTRWRNYVRKSAAITRISLSLGNGLLSSNGPLWVRQRRMLQPAFSRPAIGALLPLIVRVNEPLCARWAQAAQDGTSVDVSADMSRVTLEITLRALFGEDYPSVAGEFDLIADDPRDLEFARGFSARRELVTSIARARRERDRDGDDLLGRILKARDRDSGEPMSDSQLASEVLTLAVAGHETTASILAWTWYLLATHPRIEKRLLTEIDARGGAGPLTVESMKRLPYLQRVIEEALRLYPPAWLVTRRSLHDDQLGEFFVPAGTEIFISPYLIQRHPAFWERPDQFEPERFEGPGEGSRAALCPFGSGPRNCIGEFMARLEIQAQLVTVLRKVRLSSCGERPQICADINLTTREHLYLRPHLRAATRERVAEAASSS
ncbi:MAG TPA: cytochrome P450 [Steroidobacteraceae bacterium]|nr:cytochrome P450 [Steroidobacteraceae bacterium]